MNNAYEIAAATYLLIGILFGTIGPAGKDIAKEVEEFILPMLEKPGYMNAKGTLDMVLNKIRGK